jgi:glyoxylate reductase
MSSTHHIVITRAIPDVARELLSAQGYRVDVIDKGRALARPELLSALRKAPYAALLSQLTDRIDETVFDTAPSLKIVANYATGFDNIDLKIAKARGVVVTNAPTTASSDTVAEHTVAFMWALATKMIVADTYVRRGKHRGFDPILFVGTMLAGKTVGLIGTGRIGAEVARMVSALGLSVVYTDVVRNEALEASCGATYMETVDALLPLADFVSLHVPLLDSTHHLLSAERLRLMKPTAFVINTARGAVIDERALVESLRAKQIAGAALDVFEHEPKLAAGLSKLDNVILAPHIGSASIEARTAMAEVAANNIIACLSGAPIPNQIA